ncbi:hypothetical protein BH11PSE7_BH11PSE7_02080 [soil metagenome]
MFKTTLACLGIAALAAGSKAQAADPAAMNHSGMDHSAHMAQMPGAARQADVARRGVDVMPFSLPATLHVFTKAADGGIQKVVARKTGDASQVQLVRRHMKDIRQQFLRGDFTAPAHIHGHDMPGLAALQAARPGQIAITYREVAGGAELQYVSLEPGLVKALHAWFDAQLSDHGSDAMPGHAGHGDTAHR